MVKFFNKSLRSDYRFIVYLLSLIFFGLLILSSAGVAVGLRRFSDSYFFVKRQIYFGLIPGLIFFVLFWQINYNFFKKIAWLIYFFSLLLLLLVFIPGLGVSYGTGAKSWLNILGYSFQPAEIVKLGFIIFLAFYLDKIKHRLRNFKQGFLNVLFWSVWPLLLIILQPDIGTLAVFIVILISQLFLAGVKYSHLSLLLVVSLVLFIFMIIIAPYRAKRFMTFLHPELDPQGIGYHINQAYLAIGSGGLLGLGLGHSRQKFQYLPEVHGDSIFAIMAEELGFVVCVLFLFFLILFLRQGVIIAKRTDDYFARLLIGGIFAWFLGQSFLNIGAMVGLLPLTGLPLPFISHGGTALLTLLTGMGIVISISKYSSKIT